MNTTPEEIAELIAAIDAARASSSAGTFLTQEEIETLTGRKFKALQIKALTQMRIPFVINAVGRPIVTRSTIEGRTPPAQPIKKPKFIPNVLKTG